MDLRRNWWFLVFQILNIGIGSSVNLWNLTLAAEVRLESSALPPSDRHRGQVCRWQEAFSSRMKGRSAPPPLAFAVCKRSLLAEDLRCVWGWGRPFPCVCAALHFRRILSAGAFSDVALFLFGLRWAALDGSAISSVQLQCRAALGPSIQRSNHAHMHTNMCTSPCRCSLLVLALDFPRVFLGTLESFSCFRIDRGHKHREQQHWVVFVSLSLRQNDDRCQEQSKVLLTEQKRNSDWTDDANSVGEARLPLQR